MERGYAVIALDRPKTAENIGGIIRACHIYGVSFLVMSGTRYKALRKCYTDTTKGWKHMPFLEVNDVLDTLPYNCTPVVIECIPNAEPLPYFKHPERAFYIFGPEDGNVSEDIIKRCKHKVVIPTKYCMNLAATVNVVLYDRVAKKMPIPNTEKMS